MVEIDSKLSEKVHPLSVFIVSDYWSSLLSQSMDLIVAPSKCLMHISQAAMEVTNGEILEASLKEASKSILGYTIPLLLKESRDAKLYGEDVRLISSIFVDEDKPLIVVHPKLLLEWRKKYPLSVLEERENGKE